MQAQILNNLKRVADRNLWSDEDVTYLLIQAYKFIELDRGEDIVKEMVLGFYRDWVCHSRLSRNNVSRKFNNVINTIAPVDEDIDLDLDNVSKTSLALQEAWLRELPIRGLEEEIYHLFKNEVKSDIDLREFWSGLTSVLRETPLIIEKEDVEVFRLTVTNITRETISVEAAVGKRPYSIILSNNGLDSLSRTPGREVWFVA